MNVVEDVTRLAVGWAERQHIDRVARLHERLGLASHPGVEVVDTLNDDTDSFHDCAHNSIGKIGGVCSGCNVATSTSTYSAPFQELSTNVDEDR